MTDVSELIERVGRKLAMFMFDTYGDAPGVVWAGLDVYQREKAFKAARAAIEASGVQSLSERVVGLQSDCKFLLACIDQSNEAGAPVDESDPEDIATIDQIRAALTKEGIENG